MLFCIFLLSLSLSHPFASKIIYSEYVFKMVSESNAIKDKHLSISESIFPQWRNPANY